MITQDIYSTYVHSIYDVVYNMKIDVIYMACIDILKNMTPSNFLLLR